jgi:hypothetical protein
VKTNLVAVALLVAAAPTVFICLELLVFFLRRLFAWMDDRGWITYTGNPPTYGSLANAFLEVQSIAQPEKQHILKEKKRLRAERYDSGDKKTPGRPVT